MVLLPTLEAAVRRLTGSGVPGAAVYTRHLTRWVGFLGAMLATSSGHHLALSAVDFLREGWPRELARSFGSAVTTLICAVLAYASFDMVLLDKGRVDTLAGGVPEWWFEVVMPIGFAVMSVRGAMKAPTRRSRIFCFVIIAAVLPFVVSRALAVKGAGFLTMPDGPTLLHGHTARFGAPAGLLLFASFLLGAPVFVVMAGFALLLFYLAATPVASVPAETFRLVVSPTLPAIPLLTVAGYVLAEGGASRRLVRAAQGWFGWMPGGLAVMATFVCALFTTFTGASGVTILALGGIILPALGAAYAIVAELVLHRDVHLTRDLPRVLVHASTLVGSVVILLGVALGMTSYLVDAEIPTRLLAWVQTHIHSQWEFLLALNVLLLVLGSVLEIYSAIVVLAPLVAPLGVAFGVEPVHLGVVFLANLELGFLFPPMGLNLFLSASRFQKPLPLLYRKALPFLVIMAVGVLLITYVPAITTGVVSLLKPAR